ncbi:MAG: hypothetical protein AAF668_16170, partial [Pseudomonadota bacterium]
MAIEREDPQPSHQLAVEIGRDDANDPASAEEFDTSPEALHALLELERSIDHSVEAEIPPVKWASDAQQPDYAHSLAAERAGLDIDGTFTFDLNTFGLLATANHFRPAGDGSNVMFGLRGAVLTEGDDLQDRRAITLRDTRPDHAAFRCTLGIINLSSGRIDAFSGSTVPNRVWMRNYFRKRNNIQPFRRTNSNILPTGCYIYRVAGHSSNRIRPAMRMSNPDNLAQDGMCTVLRTYNDLVYSHNDFWDRTTPYDNIHCAYAYDSFSSAGCQTIKGPDGQGPWGRFQDMIGAFGYGKRLDYMLLTGRDASIASAILKANRAGDAALVRTCLERLRVGSQGDIVMKAQRKMGFNGTGYFGPVTKQRLTEYEKGAGLWSDGILSPDDDARLDWGSFDPIRAPGLVPAPPSAFTVML